MIHPASRLLPLATVLVATVSFALYADDWPQWRGPSRDGVWREDGILERFPPGGPPVRWRTPVGPGFAWPAVAAARVFLMDRTLDEGAMMLRFKPDAAEPEILWKASAATVPERQWEKAGFNTTMSPVLLLDGHVYGVSLYGETCCLDGDTGRRVWTTLQPTSGGDQPRERWSSLFMVPHRDRVFLFNDKGDLILARLKPSGYEEIDRSHVIDADMPSMGSGGRKVVWSHPAFAGRCVYVRNNHEIRCLSLAAASR